MEFDTLGNLPSPSDLFDILIDSVITNIFNICRLSEHQNLEQIANFTDDGKKILIKIVGGFNFYFENYYNFLSTIHISMTYFDKTEVYTNKKNQLIGSIFLKLNDAHIPFDKDNLTKKIGDEDLE